MVGDWHSTIHEQPVYDALQKLGHGVSRFSWHQYFQPKERQGYIGKYWLKAQYKYQFGPLVRQLNADLISKSKEFRPQLVFIYRGTHVFANTLSCIKAEMPNTIIVSYNNDDPFSPNYPFWMWRHFRAGIPVYDVVFAYRERNLAELESIGAKNVALLRSWFVPERNFPLQPVGPDKERFECDIVFIGHFENDGRMEALEAIAEKGWKLKLFGPGYEWNDKLKKSKLLHNLAPVDLVWGDEYNKAISGAKIALCFFSKLNRDTYTRRCFEIPACSTLLCSEYSKDMTTLFDAESEVLLFKSVNELTEKLSNTLGDENKLQRMAEAGLNRVWADGHDVLSRMRYMLARAQAQSE